MKLVQLDCPQCHAPIEFEVYDLDDSPSGERFASFRSHAKAAWFCPYQWPELRQDRAEFHKLRFMALLS